jgi:hypothetical protein
VTLPSADSLAQFAVFVARRQRVDLPWNPTALLDAVRHMEALTRSGETDEVGIFYGLAVEASRIGPVAIHLALLLIMQTLQDRGLRFGGVDVAEMRRAFGDVGTGAMRLDNLRHWIADRTTLPR